jgi:multidrug efflux system membrane fusion protein
MNEMIMKLKSINRKLQILLLTALLSIVLIGCFKSSKPAAAPPRVTTTAIKQQDVPIYIDAIGKVIAPVTINIRPQAAGKLLKAYIKQGAIVNEGDILYEIDPRPYQALLDEAVAQLAHDQALLDYANQTVKRYKTVVEDEFISQLTYEQYQSSASAAQAQVDLDKAAITAAQINLDFCKVVAPASGKISYFNVDVGNIMVVDDPNQITVLLPFSPIDISFSLPQQQFEQIRVVQGDAGEWKFVATLPEKAKTPFEGTTYFIDNQIDQDTGTILLKGRLPNEKRELWPGEFIRVKVLYKMAPKALTVPASSVLMGNMGSYIYIVDKEGKAQAINVTVLTRTDEYIAIQSDQIHAGETVIVDGQINVAPGIAVTQVTEKKS